MKGGDKHKSQMMMRGRVAMQAFTVTAIYFGMFYKTPYALWPSSWTAPWADSGAAGGRGEEGAVAVGDRSISGSSRGSDDSDSGSGGR